MERQIIHCRDGLHHVRPSAGGFGGGEMEEKYLGKAYFI